MIREYGYMMGYIVLYSTTIQTQLKSSRLRGQHYRSGSPTSGATNVHYAFYGAIAVECTSALVSVQQPPRYQPTEILVPISLNDEPPESLAAAV
jgi:hypothetical protein